MLKEGAPIAGSLRIVLVRHGQPHIALSPRTDHRGFADYIDAYEAAGLDPASLPPQELAELGCDLAAVFASDRPRSHQSAALMAPHLPASRDPLFAEAPLASTETSSQVSGLAWSPHREDIVLSMHGYTENEMCLWRWQRRRAPASGGAGADADGMRCVQEWPGASQRILYSACSADSGAVVTGSTDGKIRFWPKLFKG